MSAMFPGSNVPIPQTMPAAAPTPVENENEAVVVETAEGVDYLIAEFTEGQAKGLKYAFPKFKSVEALVAAYEADKVLELVNQSINARIATKVKNGKIPKNVSAEVAAAQLKALRDADPSGRGLVFSVDEAKAYKPGEREPGVKDLLAEGIEKARNGELDVDFLKGLLVKMSMKSRK